MEDRERGASHVGTRLKGESAAFVLMKEELLMWAHFCTKSKTSICGMCLSLNSNSFFLFTIERWLDQPFFFNKAFVKEAFAVEVN